MIQILGVAQFLAMVENGAGRAALDEKLALRAHVYNLNFFQAIEDGVDESLVHFYAQCALNDFDKGFIQ